MSRKDSHATLGRCPDRFPRALPGLFFMEIADAGSLRDDELERGEALEGAGIRVARAPVAFDQIVQRSRLLLSHGGLGFVSSGLVAGLPQVVIPFDGEKLLIATAAATTGTCLRASFEGLETAQFAAFLRAAWTDAPLHAKAHAAAAGFRARVTRPVEEQAVEMVEAMI